MEKIFEGFRKVAGRVNYLDLYGLRRGASKVVKDLRPKGQKLSTKSTNRGTDLSAHAKDNLKGSNVAGMSQAKWNKIMGLD